MIYRYAIEQDIRAYEGLGWMAVAYYGNRGGNECYLLAFPCDCEPKEPQDVAIARAKES